MQRIALIGDIISSKQLSNRSQVQEKLKTVLQQLNSQRQSQGLLSPYTITLGDEFQAVFDRADWLFLDALTILLALDPVKVRFSFGLGTLETQINPKEAMGMDGPAFHYARSGIEELKKTSSIFTIIGEHNCIQLMQPTLHLISRLAEKWQRNRWWIWYRLYLNFGFDKMTDPVL